MKKLSGALVMAITGALCFSGSIAAHDPVTTKVTWNHDIARLVEARCVGCHKPSGRAPMPLTSYDEARPWARAIREEVLARRMPKWQAARGYGEFANDPSLSPFEIAVFAAWVDGGAPQGKPETAQKKKPSRAAVSAQTRDLKLACGTQPLSGRLLAIRPELPAGGSAGVAAILPDGRREIVAWIRNYDPEFPTTYWLRSPLDLATGSRLLVESGDDCRMTVSLSRGQRPVR